MILVHYGEIALKGENRQIFEKRLVTNIKQSLKEARFDYVRRLPGRILVGGENIKGAKEKLQKVFGIANFSPAAESKPDMEQLKKDAWALVRKHEFKSFKIDARRAQKDLPFTSNDINKEVGAYVQELSGTKVRLEDPDLAIYIELIARRAFLYTQKISGPGGLPVGSAGKVVSLISSGIDSPVASWKLMKRGCEVVFVHFHSYPQTSKASLENVEKIVNVLEAWSPAPLKLFTVPFLDIQKIITAHAQDKLRVILYRRSMVRIAQAVAKREKAKALVTGESVGQVASQTLENIAVIDESALIPILRPNIGEDKNETITWAKHIGTYEISTQPYEDCCSLFVPAHPETKARLEKVLQAEEAMKKELRDAETRVLDEALGKKQIP